jgi:hypothetical protein
VDVCPFGQFEHALDPSEDLPAAHAVHSVAPEAPYVPAAHATHVLLIAQMVIKKST